MQSKKKNVFALRLFEFQIKGMYNSAKYKPSITVFSLPCTRGINALECDKMAYVVAKESKKCSLSEPQMFCSVYVLLCQDKHYIIVQGAGFSALLTRVVEIRGQTAFAALSQHHQPEPDPVRAAK